MRLGKWRAIDLTSTTRAERNKGEHIHLVGYTQIQELTYYIMLLYCIISYYCVISVFLFMAATLYRRSTKKVLNMIRCTVAFTKGAFNFTESGLNPPGQPDPPG